MIVILSLTGNPGIFSPLLKSGMLKYRRAEKGKLMFLEIKNLTVKMGGQRILDDISFNVEKGDVVAVIGPNGAGKTTLLKALMGLLPYEGEVIWHQIAKIGYVPQRFAFDRTFPLTVEELFLLKTGQKSFWFPSPLQKADITKALSHTQVESLLKQKIGQLSTGQLQRVFIAYALFGEPDLLLFDEPTAGIDIGAEMTVYNLLQEISREQKLTMMIVSHELNVVFRYATNVVCLNRRLACYGTPSEALSSEQLHKLYGPHTAFYTHDHHGHNQPVSDDEVDN